MKKSFADNVTHFFQNLDYPSVPEGVEVLYPFADEEIKRITQIFYQEYYNDHNPRTFLIGINPGRFGGGITGIPFTDPIRLKEACGIENGFEQKPELSSRFIYEVISAYGGVKPFYEHFYFTSVSPLGFTKDGKNLNYYDIKELQEGWEQFMVESMREQIAFGANEEVAFSLGMGQNIKYLKYLNKKYQLFGRVEPLPHPRWVMQYRLKRLEEFVQEYVDKLGSAV